MVPIDNGDRPGVINMVKPDGGRDVGEPARSRIQETTIALAATKWLTLLNGLGELIPGIQIGLVWITLAIRGRLRHDLSPKEAS
ncbi:MAG: hypothetical protein P8N76_05640 [Pirellulaceae bacterium]|nr:hypothetical protein [Pirellulaceae bacterium]